MEQSDFDGIEGAKPEGSSGGQFRFVVEALDYSSGNRSSCPEPVQDELSVLTEGPSDFFHRFDPGAHDFRAPAIEKAAGPVRRDVIPKKLELFLQQIAPDRPEIVLE